MIQLEGGIKKRLLDSQPPKRIDVVHIDEISCAQCNPLMQPPAENATPWMQPLQPLNATPWGFVSNPEY